jgi:hypothetical protein
MKSIAANKENNYSLHNIENYKSALDCDISEVVKKYSSLIIEYLKFITDNIKIRNTGLAKFIIIRGLDTITHVFMHTLSTTKNINLTYFHCQKSFYFYVEFVGQISEDDKVFLQLTSRDATTYVYKKTIFDLNMEFKKSPANEAEFRGKLETISAYINLHQTYLLKVINAKKMELSNLEYLMKLPEKLSHIQKITTLEGIVERLYHKIVDIDAFFEVNALLLKKVIKAPTLLCNAEKNIKADMFDEKITESPDKFVAWFLSS